MRHQRSRSRHPVRRHRGSTSAPRNSAIRAARRSRWLLTARRSRLERLSRAAGSFRGRGFFAASMAGARDPLRRGDPLRRPAAGLEVRPASYGRVRSDGAKMAHRRHTARARRAGRPGRCLSSTVRNWSTASGNHVVDSGEALRASGRVAAERRRRPLLENLAGAPQHARESSAIALRFSVIDQFSGQLIEGSSEAGRSQQPARSPRSCGDAAVARIEEEASSRIDDRGQACDRRFRDSCKRAAKRSVP